MPDTERRKAKESTAEEIELRSDGWGRFEQAVVAAAKSGPNHKPKRAKDR